MKEYKEKIRLHILVPLGLLVLLLLTIFIIAINQLQQQNIDDNVRKSLSDVQKSFQIHLEKDKYLLSALTDFVMQDKNLKGAWLAKNRDALLRYGSPLFEDFRTKYRVTHFYFHNLDKVCFLRVHNPSRYGDYINRFTLDNAILKEKPAYGIELGPFGTFTLRFVHPWYIDGTLTGYIELGEEIEHITPELKEILNIELVFIINKSYLNRADWEEGMKMMGRVGDWDLLSNFVATDATLEEIPLELRKYVKTSHVEHENLLFKVSKGGKKYYSGFVPLVDVGGREVGNIFVMKDVTENEASLKTLSKIIMLVCVVIGGVLLGSFNLYIGQIELRLTKAHNSLKDEIEKRGEIEKELRKHRDNLEDLVEERTNELQKTNEELQQEITERKKAEKDQARLLKQLEKTNRELNDLVYIMSHDLKTPLRGISMLISWISTESEDKFDGQGKQQIQLLLNRAKRMYNLIDGILQYSRVGRVKEEIIQVNLNELVPSIIDLIAPPENITITVENELPAIKCEKTRITQVFQNLLSNAVKYMDKPQGHIRIGCVEEGDYWKFSVADNGPGIEEKYYEKIFQLFQTLSSRDEVESTGIGLTIIKKIVEMYGGMIWVESKVSEGSVFRFTLPKQMERVKDEKLEASIVS